MRFSAVQEESCAIGLEQEQISDVIVESMMSAAGDIMPGDVDAVASSDSVEESSMVSNLPLLFANGYPTSLEKITLPELERFIAFMIQCSSGPDATNEISKPKWWPNEVEFANPLVRPKKTTDNWLGSLKKLVFRCYTYHRSEYLLRFCSYLAQYPHNKLEYVNNWDSTTSLFVTGTGKLLVTFRNENMNYDKKIESPRKSLLPQNGVNSALTNGLKWQKQKQKQLPMVQPSVEDIYLCDNCDAELVGFEKMRAHEKMCCEQEPSRAGSRPATPEDLCLQPEVKQDQFLDYFKLSSTKSPPLNVPKTSSVPALPVAHFSNDNRSSRRIRTTVSLTRCPNIPFSSPAGLALVKKTKPMTEEVQMERLERLERHLTAPSLRNSCRPKWLDRYVSYDRWSVTFKPNRDKPKYVHDYKFSSERGKLVLSLESQLRYIACRPAKVVLTRLNNQQIKELMQEPQKYTKYDKHIVRRLKRPRPKPLSWQRKVLKKLSLGNEIEPIVIDDDEMESSEPSKKITLAPIFNIAKQRRRQTSANETLGLSSLKKSPSTRISNGPTANEEILEIDLCSSDEEEIGGNRETRASTDENKDPMRSSEDHGLTPKKCVKPYICPADSTSARLSNVDAGNDTANILRSSARFSSIKLSP